MKKILWMVFNVGTALVGFQIHSSIVWSICDFIFSPLAWAKWLIYHEVSVSVIKSTFGFFLK